MIATILVNQDLCTRCGVGTVVCPMAIVSPADENTLPVVNAAQPGVDGPSHLKTGTS